MISHRVILAAVSSNLISALTGTNLSPAILRCFVCGLTNDGSGDSLLQFRSRLLIAVLPASTLRRDDNACRKMSQPAAVLVFVSVLTTGTGSAEPFHAEIAVLESRGSTHWGAVNDSHRHGRCMHSPAALGWRYSLYAMPAALIVQLVKINSLYSKVNLARPCVHRAMLSPHSIRQTTIGLSHIYRKQLRIIPALGGSYLDNSFHCISLPCLLRALNQNEMA